MLSLIPQDGGTVKILGGGTGPVTNATLGTMAWLGFLVWPFLPLAQQPYSDSVLITCLTSQQAAQQ